MKTLTLIVVTAFALVAAGVHAQSVRYDFDSVEVRYAAEFTARPIVNEDSENWIFRIAGGTDKPITVLYGEVDLKKSGVTIGSEGFIKVSGTGGSERFLLNSAAYDYYEGTSNYRKLKSFFWSAKKLEERDGVVSVVKDFTPPIISIALQRELTVSGELQAMTLSFSNDGQRAIDEFGRGMPSGAIYQAQMAALNQAGDAAATAGR